MNFFLFSTLVRSSARTCDELPFCSDNIDQEHVWSVSHGTEIVDNNKFSCLVQQDSQVSEFMLTIYKMKESGIRIRIEPKIEEKFRFDISKNKYVVSNDTLETTETMNTKINENSATLEFGTLIAEIDYDSLKISVKEGEKLVFEVNAQNQLLFQLSKNKAKPDKYESFLDSVPHGPTAVSADITFHGEDIHFSGLPERPSTVNIESETEPIRLFNTDGYEYDSKTTSNLYGSIPFLYAHSPSTSSAIFWMNPSDSFVKFNEQSAQFLSEGGYIDFVLFVGTYKEIIGQYTELTGKPMMPPAFALGYHQSRWGYMSYNEVSLVMRQLDEHKIPYDSIWLDLDHLDSKTPFTHNRESFGELDELMAELEEQNRFLIRVSDPHFPSNSDDPHFKEGRRMKLFVTTSKSMTFIGDGWPGPCAFPDFTNPSTVDWWSKLYNYGIDVSRENVFPWNDMNEPSIFKGFEATFPKDALHHGGIENREVHNIYGLLNSAATYKGLLNRNPNKDKRPFALTRSFFAGSQKFAFTWTGDNTAAWDQLGISMPMILAQGISGMPFTGADVGGFMRSPDDFLLARWYQLATWCYPFFREHCHHKSMRREPNLYDNNEGKAMKNAIETRYKMLPLWYTASWEAHNTGVPPVRPLFIEFPDDAEAHGNEDSFMLSNSILVTPITDEDDETITRPELPGIWYNFQTGKNEQEVDVKSVLSYPVFIRGGSIVPTFIEAGNSTYEAFRKPMKLIIALDEQKKASGKVYLDDGNTFGFENGEYILRQFIVENGKLTCKEGDDKEQKVPEFLLNTVIEQVAIMSEGENIKTIEINKKLAETWTVDI